VLIQDIIRKFHAEAGCIGYVPRVVTAWEDDAEVHAKQILAEPEVNQSEEQETLAYLLAYAAYVLCQQLKNHHTNPVKNPDNQRQNRLIFLAEQLSASSNNSDLCGYIHYVQSWVHTLEPKQDLERAQHALKEAITLFEKREPKSYLLLAHVYYALGALFYFYPEKENKSLAKRHFLSAYEYIQQTSPHEKINNIDAVFLCSDEDIKKTILHYLKIIDAREKDYIRLIIEQMIPPEHRRVTHRAYYSIDVCTLDTILEGFKASIRFDDLMHAQRGSHCAWHRDALLLSRAALPYYMPPPVGTPVLLDAEQQKILVYLLAHAAWVLVRQARPAYVTDMKEALHLLKMADDVVLHNKHKNNALLGYLAYVKSVVYRSPSDQKNRDASEHTAREAVNFFQAESVLHQAYAMYQLGCILLDQGNNIEAETCFQDAHHKLRVYTGPKVCDALGNQFEVDAMGLLLSTESDKNNLLERVNTSLDAVTKTEQVTKMAKLDLYP
jgi:hypothetical protein